MELTRKENILSDSVSVYVDMSGGMLFAYDSLQHKRMLQAVINRLAANDAIHFLELSSGRITPLEMSHTQLYNYMMLPQSYNNTEAPIEEALKRIVSSREPALLMTDFEEYRNGVVERAAYAKRYFIEWIAKGYNITFYKWNYSLVELKI